MLSLRVAVFGAGQGWNLYRGANPLDRDTTQAATVTKLSKNPLAQ
jgi:hypothetical protein